MSKNILVTGGAGFIGSHVVDELVIRGHDVTIFDNLDEQVHVNGIIPKYLNKNARFIKGDVRDYESFKKIINNGIEVIFHQAACVGVGQSQYQIKKYVDVNIGGTANLLDILANSNHSVQKLIVAASMSGYGEGLFTCERCGTVKGHLRDEKKLAAGDWNNYCSQCLGLLKPLATTEDTPLVCNSIYAITKKVQEEMVLNYGKTYNLPVVALRYFNVYGPRQSLSNPYTGVAAIFISRIKNNNPPVIYEDGLQTRDFVSVRDIVQANILALEKEEANYEVFNVGMQNPLTILSIAEKLTSLMKSDLKPHVMCHFRKGDIRHCFADISKIKNKLGYKPTISFEEGMKELVDFSASESAFDYFEEATAQLKERALI